jgi:hypothetical protein
MRKLVFALIALAATLIVTLASIFVTDGTSADIVVQTVMIVIAATSSGFLGLGEFHHRKDEARERESDDN